MSFCSCKLAFFLLPNALKLKHGAKVFPRFFNKKNLLFSTEYNFCYLQTFRPFLFYIRKKKHEK